MNKYTKIYFNELQKKAERELTPEEEENIKKEQSNFLPRLFRASDDPGYYALEKPWFNAAGLGLVGGYVGGGIGSGLGAIIGSGARGRRQANRSLVTGGLAGLLGGSVIGALIGKKMAEKYNQSVIHAIRRTEKENPTLWDVQQEMILQPVRNINR